MVPLDQQKRVWLLIFIMTCSIVLYMYISQSPKPIIPSINIQDATTSTTLATLPQVKGKERILVLYVWANIDVQVLGNLEFFVRHGVSASQPIDYYFILQKVNNTPVDESRLPRLPSNAHYLQHENECYDIGTFGWFFSQNIVNTTLYKYFIFMNSSIRGPFFVPYFATEGTSWFEIFTKRITDEIKLVGPTINCEQMPHVQSYLMVTDQVGFSILNGNQSKIFRCYLNRADAILNGEIVASQMILRANYQIASLQSKYQGLDFRKSENQACNGKKNPIFYDNRFDGISHDPFELIFVKFKGNPPFDTMMERRALVYQKWLEERPRFQEKKSKKTR